jgi:phage terminase large subunit-like protein
MSKTQRVKKLAPLIEAGFIRFRADQKELVEQLSMFTPDGPKSAYDDEADALWYAYEEASEGTASGTPSAVSFDRFGVRSLARRVLKGFRR